MLLLIPLLIGGSYVVGYFVCSWSTPWHDVRVFHNVWQFEFFAPLVRIERQFTGRKILSGCVDP